MKLDFSYKRIGWFLGLGTATYLVQKLIQQLILTYSPELSEMRSVRYMIATTVVLQVNEFLVGDEVREEQEVKERRSQRQQSDSKNSKSSKSSKKRR